MIKMNFGQRFKMLRKELGFNQVEFCEYFNKNREHKLSTTSVSQYEHNKRIPENPRLLELAEFFNVSVDYLLGVSDIRNDDTPYDPDALKITELLERPEYRILFEKTKDMSEEEIERIVKIIELTQGK